MEKTLINLRQQISALLTKGIEISPKAKNDFLQIMAILYGTNSDDYNYFKELTVIPEKQSEMLAEEENRKNKKNFMVFCHIVLVDYIQQLSLSEQTSSKNICNYFSEIEKVSQYRPGITGLNLEKFPRLVQEEIRLTRHILSRKKLPPDERKKVLSVWLMYPQLIHHPEKIKEVITLFSSEEIES